MSTSEPTAGQTETRKCSIDTHIGELHETCMCGEIFFARSEPYRLRGEPTAGAPAQSEPAVDPFAELDRAIRTLEDAASFTLWMERANEIRAAFDRLRGSACKITESIPASDQKVSDEPEPSAPPLHGWKCATHDTGVYGFATLSRAMNDADAHILMSETVNRPCSIRTYSGDEPSVNAPPLTCSHCRREIEEFHQHEIKGQDGYEGFYCRPLPAVQCCSWHGPKCAKDAVYCCEKCPTYVPAPAAKDCPSKGCPLGNAHRGPCVYPKANAPSAPVAEGASDPQPIRLHRRTLAEVDEYWAKVLETAVQELGDYERLVHRTMMPLTTTLIAIAMQLRMPDPRDTEIATLRVAKEQAEIERVGAVIGMREAQKQTTARDRQLEQIAKVATALHQRARDPEVAGSVIMGFADRILAIIGTEKSS